MNESTQKLAERIALLLQENEKPQNDFSALQSSLEKINQRLDKIETQIAFQNSNPQSQILNPKSYHPSQEKFAIAEAVADEIIEHLNTEKACQFEPNGKPCDHCSMCNSRGF
jgi:hypothetical protein